LFVVGEAVGFSVGVREGEAVGCWVGVRVGAADAGTGTAAAVGARVGGVVGVRVGAAVGFSVGDVVGAADGAAVTIGWQQRSLVQVPDQHGRVLRPTPLVQHVAQV